VTDQGVVQNVVHVDSTLSRTQEAVLLMLTINGSTLAWLLRTRKSGMKDSYESFAVLASLVVAHDGFLPYFVPLASGTSHLVPLLKIGVAENILHHTRSGMPLSRRTHTSQDEGVWLLSVSSGK